MKNMKHLKALGALAAGALLVGVGQTASANIIESGTSLLPTSTGPAADNLSVAWSVDLTSTVYTYSYQVINPSGDKIVGNGNPEYVDSFSVTVPSSLIIPGSPAGGTSTPVVDSDSVTWTLPSVIAGTEYPVSPSALTFESTLPPKLGNDNASDAVPPSPWSSAYPGGQEVPVPAPLPVPDGGLTVALLGGALIALRSFGRKNS